MASPQPRRVVRFYVPDRELSTKRIGGAMAALAKLRDVDVERVTADEADFIWENTPQKATRNAREKVKVYNHIVGASVLESKTKLARLQSRMGTRTLESVAFTNAHELTEWFAAHAPLEGSWVAKDASANSGVGLWFFDGGAPLPLAIEASVRGEVVLQSYVPKPMLWRGRKLQFRCYACFDASRCWLYDGAMAQVCNRPFVARGANDEWDPEVHVTNVSVNDSGETFQAERPIADLALEHPVCHAGVLRVVKELARALSPFVESQTSDRHFEFVGLDFVCDSDGHAWLIECNCPPNMHGSEPSGPIEDFHQTLAVDLLDLYLLEGSSKWTLAFSSEKAPCPSKRLGVMARLAHGSKWEAYEATLRRWFSSKAEPPASHSTRTAKAARKEFAFFDEEQANNGVLTNGNEWAFLENAGGSQVPRCVVSAVGSALERRWRSELGARHRANARTFARRWLGCEEGDVILGPNASSLFDTLARSSAATTVVICEASHQANRLPWLKCSTVLEWRLRDRRLYLADLELLLGGEGRLVVALPHASNVSGEVYDVAACVSTIRAVRPAAFIIVDGVAVAPHRRVDFKALKCDAYVVATHKAFGPHAACAAVTKRLLEFGPNARYAGLPEAWELGTPSAEACAGIAALETHFDALASLVPGDEPTLDRAYEAIAIAEAAPFRRLLLFLRSNAAVKILADEDDVDGAAELRFARLPTVAFVHDRIPPPAIVEAARQKSIALRHGDFLSPTLLAALGYEAGVVRVSIVHYNTCEEIDRLIECLVDIPRWDN